MPGTVKSAQGEDRSSYQVISPWTANEFGFAKATEGLAWTDPTFGANWEALHQAQKFRGAYHFFHPQLNAEEQAEFFFSFVQKHGLAPGDMLVVDSEVIADPGGALLPGDSNNGMATPHVPLSGTLAAAGLVGDGTLAFLTKLGVLLGKDRDRCPRLVYTSLSVASVLGACTEFELWIAHPALDAPPSVAPWKNWRFWQWGFGGGPGGGDRDAYNGTLAELTEWINSFKNRRA